MNAEFLRKLPKMDKILSDPRFASHGRLLLKAAASRVLDKVRKSGVFTDNEDIFAMISEEYGRLVMPKLRRVINASGVLLHTNLGRAPIDKALVIRAAERAAGYSTLEYDTDSGSRGDRYSHSAELIKILTDADDALIVNNNAAALFLIANTLAKGREVIVSRGELAEIGGGFRISDMLIQASVKLCEVGSVNKTYAADYENAVNDNTALIMKIARSNYSIEGFVREAELAEVAAAAKKAGVPSYFDAGSAAFHKSEVFRGSYAAEYIAAGYDVVSFSADKLFGSIQAGIIIGNTKYLNMMRRNPIVRLVRPDKLTLAILHESLIGEFSGVSTPLERMASLSRTGIFGRSQSLAEKICAATGVMPKISEDFAVLGGGAGHGVKIECASIEIPLKNMSPDDAAEFLRSCKTPVIARISDGKLKISLRGVDEGDEDTLALAVTELLEKDAAA